MSDLISRQAAIDAFWKLDVELRPSAMDAVVDMLKSLPTAEPNRASCKQVTGKLDLIGRQEAIEAIMSEPPDAHYPSWYADVLKGLPSACNETKQQATVSSDCISREDAIDAINAYLGLSAVSRTIQNMTSIQGILENLPSAELEIIHCKNCKHRDSNDCPMHYEEWIEIDEGDGYFDTDNIIHDWTTDEGFCHCAELRGKEE